MACQASLSVQQQPDLLTVTVHGKMLNEEVCAELRDVLNQAVQTADLPVVLDISEVRILPSLAIGLLLEMHKKMRQDRRRLIVAGAQRMVRDVLHLTRVEQVLELADSPDLARSLLRTQRV